MTTTAKKDSTRKKLVLIDGHAMIHRAFHAVPEEMATRSGEVVNATFGFTSLLMKALNEEKPEYIAMTFDRSAPTFRHQQYAQYKATRPTMPDIMRPQFGRIREVVEAFGIPIYEKDGFEADDVLGTLSVQATQQGIDTIIFTGDMDTLQLVDDHVTVKVAKRGISEVVEYDVEEVKKRYNGVEPLQLPDWKGLVGDKSDNIPGVPGIGEKTASKLITDYGSLENVLAHINELKPKEQRLLGEHEAQALESKFLATIVRNVPVQLDLSAARVGQANREKVLAIFRQLEFRSLIDRAFALFGEESGESGAETPAASTANTADNATEAKEATKTSLQTQSSSIQEDEEEELLLAAPLGIVPILTPPIPPTMAIGSESALPFTVASIRQEEKQKAGTMAVAEAEVEDGPTQMSLFEMALPQPETVRRLRMPGLPTPATPLLIEEPTDLSTSTMIVNSEEALDVLVKSLYAAGGFGFDTETTSEDPWHAELVGISLAMAPGEAYYIPVGHVPPLNGEETGPQLPLKYVLEHLKPVLEDASIKKYMHNAKYDIQMMALNGIQLRGLAFDTMLGAYLTDPGRRGLGLKDQAFQRLGHVMTPITQLIGTGSKAISMAQVPIRQAADYAGADADMTLRLVEPVRSELEKHSLMNLYNNVELPLLPVLMQMEMYGVALDADFLRELEMTLGEQIAELERKIYDSVGHQFNINSTKQLGDILFSELKLPAGKKTKTGYSVSADVIEGLRGKHPMVDSLLEYRQLAKLKST
ncbi:MAG TPA: DNA polymerase, partial [Ktedonobacteraceae bacterium]|nr:DNA polymerase [Ktedonobacteraceae bacterium]